MPNEPDSFFVQLDDESVMRVLRMWNDVGARAHVDSRECDAHKDVLTAQEAVRRAHRILLLRGPSEWPGSKPPVNLTLCDDCLRAAGVAV